MSIPTSMGAHKLEVLKGDRNSILDDTIILKDDQGVDTGMVAGRVCSIVSGKLVAGLTLHALAYFAWSGLDSNNAPDVTRDRGMPYSGQVRFGVISGKAACELSSTEVGEGLDETDYTPGTLLTGLIAGATDATLSGLIVPVQAGTDQVVGIVSSRSWYMGPDGYATVAFYPHHVDGSTTLDSVDL